MQRLRGLRDFVHDMVEKTVDLVQETQESVAKKPRDLLSQLEPLREPVQIVDGVRRGISDLVYDSIRLTNRGVQWAEEVGFAAVERLLTAALEKGELPRLDGALGAQLELWSGMAQAALNALAGDYLHERENGLSIRMGLRHEGRWLVPTPEALAAALPQAGSKLCIFVHGLGCSEEGFSLFGSQLYGRPDANYPSLLREELGYQPLFVRYNTGRHISENARELSHLLEALHAAYPCALERIVLVGHSMGGLVVRGAAHYGAAERAHWVETLSHVVCLGSPHLGAPLEQAANLLASLLGSLDTPATQVLAKLLKARSAGIKDLRFGYVVDDDWRDGDPDGANDGRTALPLVPHVTYCAIASTLAADDAHPLAEVMGDLLVRVRSASGHCPDETRRIAFHDARVLSGIHHLALLNHPAVYAELKRCLAERAPSIACERAQVPAP